MAVIKIDGNGNFVQLPEQSGAPPAADTGSWRLIAKASGLVAVDDNATEHALAAGTLDHGALAGLADDDHTQYMKADGTRAFTGNVQTGTNPVLAQENSSTPTTPDGGYRKLYAKNDGWYDLDSNGTETQLGSSGSGGGITSGCLVAVTNAPTISAASELTLSFDSEAYDTDDYFDAVSDTTTLSFPSSGLYLIQGNVRFYYDSTPTPAGIVMLSVVVAGGASIGGVAYASNENEDYWCSASYTANFTTSHDMQMTVRNLSGQTITIFEAYLSVTKLGSTLATP